MLRPFAKLWARRQEIRWQPLQLSDTTVVYAIGDIHGGLDLFERLQDFIADDAADGRHKTIIVLGDFVDRGPQSCEVVARLLSGVTRGGIPIRSVAGNHERAMLAFVNDPAAHQQWLKSGGEETLVSYGVDPLDLRRMTPRSRRYRDLIVSRIGKEHLAFLRQLPDELRTARYVFTHRPPATRQTTCTRTIVHAHTMVVVPTSTPGAINVDTGAFQTGRLTAVRLASNEPPQFLQVGPSGERQRPVATDASTGQQSTMTGGTPR